MTRQEPIFLILGGENPIGVGFKLLNYSRTLGVRVLLIRALAFSKESSNFGI